MNFILHFISRWIWSHIFFRIGRVPWVFWGFFLIFVITSILTWKFYDLKYNGVTAIGTIVGTGNPDEKLKWVKFVSEDGKDRNVKITIPVFYELGAPLKVYYDKQHPINAYANTHWNSWGVFVFGLIILGIGIFIIIIPSQTHQGAVDDTIDEHYSDAVHYDAPHPPPKEGCIANALKIIAVIMVLSGVAISYKYLRLSWYGNEVTATVITAQKPDLRAPYTTNAKSLYFLDEAQMPIYFYGIKLEDYEIGDEIAVLYNPEDARDFIVNNAVNGYGTLFAGLFLMLYAWGPGLIRRFIYRMKLKIYSSK